jgi:DNA-binding HxlR family transcriptional regulator
MMFILQAVDHGAKTFTDIRHDIGDANTKILTDRLGELVEVGVLSKSKEEGIYALTGKGRQLAEKLIALGEWWGKNAAK